MPAVLFIDVLEHLLATLYLDTAGVRTLTGDAPVNTDDNMLVEFRGPADQVWEKAEASPRIIAALDRLATPIEAVLTDPARLLGSRERLEGLIEGLRQADRPTARYEALLPAAG